MCFWAGCLQDKSFGYDVYQSLTQMLMALPRISLESDTVWQTTVVNDAVCAWLNVCFSFFFILELKMASYLWKVRGTSQHVTLFQQKKIKPFMNCRRLDVKTGMKWKIIFSSPLWWSEWSGSSNEKKCTRLYFDHLQLIGLLAFAIAAFSCQWPVSKWEVLMPLCQCKKKKCKGVRV